MYEVTIRERMPASRDRGCRRRSDGLAEADGTLADAGQRLFAEAQVGSESASALPSGGSAAHKGLVASRYQGKDALSIPQRPAEGDVGLESALLKRTRRRIGMWLHRG